MQRVRTWMLGVGVLLAAMVAGGIAAGTTVEDCRAPAVEAAADAPGAPPTKCYRGGELIEIRCPGATVYDVRVDWCVAP